MPAYSGPVHHATLPPLLICVWLPFGLTTLSLAAPPRTCSPVLCEQGLLLLRRRAARLPGRTHARRAAQVPALPLPPPYAEDWKLQDGKRVTRKLYDSLVTEVTQINRAVALLPELPPFEQQ